MYVFCIKFYIKKLYFEIQLDGLPTIQYSARSARFFKLNDLHISTSLASVMTDMSCDSIVDRHCLRQGYVSYAVDSHPTSQKTFSCTECTGQKNDFELMPTVTRRPASADRTARRQFQAAFNNRYEAKCVQRTCFQWGSVPLRSDIKGTELPPANILIPLEKQLIALQLFI